jgi:hypothetical protein
VPRMKDSRRRGKGGGFRVPFGQSRGRRGEGGTPSEPESSGDDEEEEDEDEEEGEITPSPPPKDLPSLGNLFSQQAEISVGAHRAKRP